MKLIIGLLIILIVLFCLTNVSEGFSPYGPYMINEFKGGNGSAPAGVNALPGLQQFQQNANASSVDPVHPGNPQNVYPEYKQQPF